MDNLTDEDLRNYLLGDGTEADRQKIEELYVTDAQVNEQLEIVETELIDDYVRDELSAADRARFEERFTTKEYQFKIRMARSIQKLG